MKNLTKAVAIVGLIAALTLPAKAVNATFQVNMEVQAAIGQFDPFNDFVYLAGTFTSWEESPILLSPTATNALVFETTVDLAAGSFPNFKYLKNRFGIGDQWEVNGVGPDGAQNRWFQVPATDTNLPAVYFNNITNVDLHHAPVTFQVDMSVQIAQGSFDPDAGTLWIAGDAINNWDISISPIALSRSQVNPNLWTTTLEVTNPAGGTVSYKYVLNGNWESVADRTFIMPQDATQLPIVYFNNVTNVAVPIPMTFSVNMGVQIARGTFEPDGGIVEVRGSFLTGPGSTWLGGIVLTNDAANPLIYSGTYLNTNDAVGSTLQYQFVLNNGTTWESTGNRNYDVASTNAIVFPVAFFSNVADLGPVNVSAMVNDEATLTWTPGPKVRLQSSANLDSWTTVPDTEGQGSTTVNLHDDMQFFRLVGP